MGKVLTASLKDRHLGGSRHQIKQGVALALVTLTQDRVSQT